MIKLLLGGWGEEMRLGRGEMEVVRMLGLPIKVEEEEQIQIMEESSNESHNSDASIDDDKTSKAGVSLEDIFVPNLEEICENLEDIAEVEETDTQNFEDSDAKDVYEELDCTEPLNENFKCPDCGFTVDGEDDLKLHVAEVHMDSQLNVFVSKMFPDNDCKVKVCGEIFCSDYEKKEHVILQHPWPKLASAVKEAGTEVCLETEKDKADVVTKIIELKAEQLKEEQAKIYQCNRCDKTWNKNTALTLRISQHLCSKHHKVDMDEAISLYFKDNLCTLSDCGASLGSPDAMKKHLIGYHRYFQDIIGKDMDQILGDCGVTQNKKNCLKRRNSQSEKIKPSKWPKTSSIIPKNTPVQTDYEKLAENEDIARIQQYIEFSDSDDED